MNIYERIKRFKWNGNEPIADVWDDRPLCFEPRWSNTRRYKMALVYNKELTITAIVVDTEEDEIKLEQDENFIKWISSWIEVKFEITAPLSDEEANKTEFSALDGIKQILIAWYFDGAKIQYSGKIHPTEDDWIDYTKSDFPNKNTLIQYTWRLKPEEPPIIR